MARQGDGEIPELNVNRDGNEISLNIDETNKLRLSLGLKPLQMTNAKPAGPSKQELDAMKKKEQDQLAADLKARITAHRDKRNHETFMRIKTLGEADADDTDDMSTWAARIAGKAEAFKSEKERKRAEDEERRLEVQRKRALEDSDNDDEDEEGRYSAKHLAGLKVKHDANEIIEGETVILTLADRAILGGRGHTMYVDEEEDELENVLKAEDKKRGKAMEASGKKAKPLWEEDGKRRKILDKYDEQEEQALMLDASGGVEADKQRRQEEMRKRLEEGNKILDSAATSSKAAGDYYTENEVAAMKAAGEGKKKKKKERKIRAKVVDEEDTADLIRQLEAEAEAKELAGVADATGLGSRLEKLAAKERAQAAEKSANAEKRARFDRALDKANWASQALKPGAAATPAAVAEDVAFGDEVDAELYESLARSRRQAQVKAEEADGPRPSSLDDIAASAAVKREEEETALKEGIKSGLALTETSEFVRNIRAEKSTDKGGNKSKVAVKDEEDLDVYTKEDMDTKDDVKMKGQDEDMGGSDDVDAASEQEEEEEEPETLPGRWVTAEDSKAVGRSGRQIRKKVDDEDADTGGIEHVTNEAAVGRGLASVLGLLKDKGELNYKEKLVWAGRNSDKSKNALQVLGDTYTGGAHEEKYAQSIEMALTKKDEFGRILTPKERFRELCYQFHGMQPSKNKQAKRLKKAAEEIAMHKVATSESIKEVDKMVAVQKLTAQPYILLSGKDASKSLKAAAANMSGSSSSRLSKPPKGGGGGGGGGGGRGGDKPRLGALGGGHTPLLGDRKVEVMLGVKKPTS